MDKQAFLYSFALHTFLALGLWAAFHIKPTPKMPLHRVLPVKFVSVSAITAAPPPRRQFVKPLSKPISQFKKNKALKAVKPPLASVKKPAGSKISTKQKMPIPKIDTIKPTKVSPKTASGRKEDAFEKLLQDVATLKDTKHSPKTNGFEADLISHKLSLSELDALRQQIQQCWVVPPSMLSEKDLLVEVGIHLNPEGVIQSLKVLNRSPPLKTPVFQVAVDSIRQALKAPACTPLRMPKGKYQQWKYCVLRFQPKGIL